MKKYIYITLICVFSISEFLGAATYNGNISVTTQAQLNLLNTLSSYSGITGNLIIGGVGSDINNLAPLSVLEHVGGNLTIRNTLCTTLNGLDKLSEVGGSLTISNNPSLTSLSDLSSITQIDNNISINNNALLTNYCSLSSIAATKLLSEISITGNKYNPTYAQLTSSLCTYRVYNGDLILSTVAQMQDFFNRGYMEVDGDLIIDDQVSGTFLNIDFLVNLTKITGDLHIIWHYALQDLDGLQNLKYVGGDVHIGDNALLTSLSGLESLETCGGMLQIHSNNKMVNFCAINNLAKTIPDTRIQIHSNPFNPSNANFVANDCSRPWYIGDVTLTTQNEVDVFGSKGYTYILGNLTIDDATGTSITRLNSLEDIDSVGGIIQVLRCRNLTSLDDIASIESMNGIALSYLNALTNLTGFNNLQELESGVTIVACPFLETINAFNQLRTSGSIIFNACQNLNQINGFSNLAEVNGYITFNNLYALTEISNFTALDKLQHLYFKQNENLSLIRFNDLDTITGTLEVTSNNSLIMLDDFDALRSIGIVYIGTNKQNEEKGNRWLKGYCDLSAAITKLPSTDLHIENNFYNPDSVTFTLGYCNQTAPRVVVEKNIVATERSLVQLDASASFDYQNDSLTYTWNVPLGIELSDIHSASPTFTAPIVDEDLAYYIQLLVDDGYFSAVDTVKVVVHPAEIPVANAGINRLTRETFTVTLDGSASFDPDDLELTYAWNSLDGIELSDTTIANPVFTVPLVEQDTQFYFELTVSNGFEMSKPDTVYFHVFNNTLPLAKCISDYSLREGSYITLKDSNSYDPEKADITYHWLLPDGIESTDTTLAELRIKTPTIHSDTNLVFQLFTYDGIDYSLPDTLVVSILNNQVPIANAGSNQEINEGEWVEFTAQLSSDVEGDSLSYQWNLPDGIESESTTDVILKFMAPSVSSNSTYTFSLVVSDGIDQSTPVFVELTVRNAEIVSQHNTSEANIQVWPNPASEHIVIHLNREYTLVQYELLTIGGKLIDSERLQNTSTIHRYLNATPGIYLVRIVAEGKILSTQKLVVQ